jgi:hypothetical protein
LRKHNPKTCHERIKIWEDLVERREEEGVWEKRGRRENCLLQLRERKKIANEIFWVSYQINILPT